MEETCKKSLYSNVILAGFGGQGLMFIGKLLAYSGMKNGKHVTWIPSYGPEMRGGTANCTVVISDEEIGSPVITSPQALIVMNNPSEGLLNKLRDLVDTFISLIRPRERSDLQRVFSFKWADRKKHESTRRDFGN